MKKLVRVTYFFTLLAFIAVTSCNVMAQSIYTEQHSQNTAYIPIGKDFLVINRIELDNIEVSNGDVRNQQVKNLVHNLNQQAKRDVISIEAVEQFLATIKANKNYQRLVLEKFAEITYLHLLLENHIKSIPIESSEVKALVKQATIEQKKANYEKVDLLLQQAVELSIKEQLASKANLKALNNQIAHLKAAQASLSLLRLEKEDRIEMATGLFQEAFELKKLFPDSISMSWLFEAGDVNALENKLTIATELFDQANKICLDQLNQQPNDTDWIHNCWLSHIKLASALKEIKLDKSLEHYHKAIYLAEKLVNKDAENTQWQINLIISYDKLSDLLFSKGDLDQALNHSKKSEATMEKLALKDINNNRWQHELSISKEKVANVFLRQKNEKQALEYYLVSKKIRENLLVKDNDNSQWQRYFSVNQAKLAELFMHKGDLDESIKYYQASVQLLEKLVNQDDQNTLLLNDLAQSYSNLAGVYRDKSDKKQAILFYWASITIREDLVSQFGANADWQYELAETRDMANSLLFNKGKADESLVNYLSDLATTQKLIKVGSKFNKWQSNLADDHMKIGDLLNTQGNSTKAILQYKACLETLEKLTKTNGEKIEWQQKISRCNIRIADILIKEEESAQAYKYYYDALLISEKLAQDQPADYYAQFELPQQLLRLGLWKGKEVSLEQRQAWLQKGVKVVESMSKLVFSYNHQQMLNTFKIALEIVK